MNLSSLSRWTIVLLLYALFPVNTQVLGDLKVAVIRVSFPLQDYPGVTGNGDFLYTETPIECGNYTLDPPPHDGHYFISHLEAVNNYYRSVSYGKFGIDLQNSAVFPLDNESSYLINTPMNYYHEIGQDEVHEKRITELLRDAVTHAYEVDNIDFSQFDLITIVHPGVGQDFQLPFLDPTPEDIPSTYVDENMVNTHMDGSIQVGVANISHGIIIPETQNHLFYDETLFNQLNSPCDIQYSITGTLTMMVGFAVGLPPLWDLESGLSGVGVFTLMDQGSNNGRGIIPAPPDAWTRIYAGWEETTTFTYPGELFIQSGAINSVAKIPMSTDEYYLIENRNNWYRDGVSIDSARYGVWEKTETYPPFIHVLIDSVGVKKNAYGVITDIPNYDLGLPASGLLIWHIDEQKIREGLNSFSVNGDRKHRGIDLEEADGAQDMGYVSNLFTDPSSGYWGDMWFAENQEYFRANAEGSLDFSSFTYPNTKSNSGANSGINISNISKAEETMSFTLSSSYDVTYLTKNNKSILFQWDVDGDGDLDFVGEGDSLWWGDDLNNINAFYKNDGEDLQICVAQSSIITNLAVKSKKDDKIQLKWFEFDFDTKNFILIWKNWKPDAGSTRLLKAEYVPDKKIWILDNDSQFIVSEGEFKKTVQLQDDLPYRQYSPLDVNRGSRYYLNPEGLSVASSPLIENFIFKGDFNYLTLVDFENDGHAEIILTDNQGKIHALDSKLIYKNGFPIEANAVGPILGLDIMENENPELVYQGGDGSIRILNNEGVEMDRISTGDKLKGLGIYDGNHAILTEKKIYKYKKSSNTSGNEWNYTFGTPDFSRILKIKKTVMHNTYLLDENLTYGYPNPTYGENVIFRIQVGQAENIEINIFDIAGFPVEELKKDFQLHNISLTKYTLNGVVEIPWDVSNIQSGVYLARVIVNGDGKSQEKIIKVGVIK